MRTFNAYRTVSTLLFALVALSLSGADTPKQSPSAAVKEVRKVGVEDFDRLRAKKNTVVLDVRTAEEFTSGHIPGAVNLDFRSATFKKDVAKLDKKKTYLVHCAGGVRSAKACSIMETLSFPDLVDLKPGFRAWEKAGKPVKKGK